MHKSMEEITFCSITPLFRFELEPNPSLFAHSGVHKDARYEIRIVKPESGPDFSKTLLPWADRHDLQILQQIHLSPRMIAGVADYFLTINVAHEYTEKLKPAGNTLECLEIRGSILDALRLKSTRGLLYYTDYEFRSIPNPYVASSASGTPLIDQYLFSHLGNGPSVLNESDFATCQAIFEKLLSAHHDHEKDSDKLLELALSYHQVAFKLEKVQHSFLILMIIFESIFKQLEEHNITNAAKRIGDQLGNTDAEKTAIRKEFDNNVPNTFGKLRNDIAHGSSALDIHVVKDKYPTLYGYITRAIVHMLGI